LYGPFTEKCDLQLATNNAPYIRTGSKQSEISKFENAQEWITFVLFLQNFID